MKTIGVIGGLGPETTEKFYNRLITLAKKENSPNRPNIIIINTPISYKEENDLLACGIIGTGYKECIINVAKTLEKAGADFIVMPCNTLHIFIEDLRESVNITVLSILEEVTKNLKNDNVKDIGVVSTGFTAKHQLYENILVPQGMHCKHPSILHQKELDSIINRLVSGKLDETDKQTLEDVIASLDESNILLGCTDLQLLNPLVDSVTIHDTMAILAEATIKYASK